MESSSKIVVVNVDVCIICFIDLKLYHLNHAL